MLQVCIIILAVSYFELLGLWQLCVTAWVQFVFTIRSVLSETEVSYGGTERNDDIRIKVQK